MNPNLQPLRDLADTWRRKDIAKLDKYSAVGIADMFRLELTAALDRMESQACDCTSGRDHVHTGDK